MTNQTQKQEPTQNPNLDIWEAVKHVGPKMLSPIQGGNLSRKSNINAQWRLQRLTEVFGPCGFGWNVKEVERWTNEAAGEIGAFVKVELTVKIGQEWSQPIEGVGGSRLCARTKDGPVFSDEAWKMATTDAISVACKMIGVGADVYLGIQSHNDTDQQGAAEYAGTKYDRREWGQNSSQTTRTSNRPSGTGYTRKTGVSAASTGNNTERVVVTAEMVAANKAHKLVTALSGHDYDDPQDWQAGLGELRAKYDFAPGVIEQIEQLAVAERDARQQPSIPAGTQIDDLPDM